MTLKKACLAWIFLVMTGACAQTEAAAEPQAAPQLKVLKTIATGSTGKWDYLCVDSEARRLYIPRSTHVQVVDLDSGAAVGDIPDTNGVHGVALAQEQNLGFASNGRDNAVTVFDLKTLKVKTTIKAGNNPDAILFDSASKHIMVMNHKSGDVTVIDPANLQAEPQKITVGGTLEFAVADGAGHVFVNVEDKNEVVEIDSKANRVLAHWSIAPGEGPTGLALDNEHHRLYVGCSNQKMIILDSETGKQIAAVDIGKGVDGVVYDAKIAAAASANGKDGTLSVVKETSPGKFAAVQTPKTRVGARTITIDPKTHHFLLPCTEADAKGAQSFVIVVVGDDEDQH